MRIELPRLGPETSHTCLPACVRIVLAYYGHEHSEEYIAAQSNINRRGARFEHVERFLRSLDYVCVRLKDAGLNDLFDFLVVEQPMIVALGAEHLPYAKSRTTHAVVICGLAGDEVYFVDPAHAKEIKLNSMEFFNAWTSRGRSGLVIQRPD